MRTAIVILSLLAGAVCQADTTVIHAGTLLATPGSEPRSRQTIIIDGNRISDVRDGFADPSSLPGEVTAIDLSDKFVLPGLMDMHTHLTGELSPNTRNEALYVTTSMETLRGAHYALKTLRAGFTTVRNVGAKSEAIYALRDAIRDGYVPGPRIFAAGSTLAATGGHGDVDGYKAELLALWTPRTICDGPHDCRRAVRHAVKFGADWIKITATGGVLSDTATGLNQQMTDDELVEIMQTAHSLGVKVAAHAHGTDGINAALRAGVDSIEHGTFLDRESIRLMKQTGAYLVPTLSPGFKVAATMEGNPFFTDNIKAKVIDASEAAARNFGIAYKAGVNIAFGTDSAVTPHGENADEFAMMVNAGMREMDAIFSATVAAAALLEQSNILGTIEAGKLADIIAVDGNPLEDITVLENVAVVIKDGRIVN
ncbi:MAG: amidohydrolase family protein [Gammaproteobacteria bacterium]|nr:amidohydrolase family protein [Gammaproteobacteria bacterium]